jgi:hypothetical protein
MNEQEFLAAMVPFVPAPLIYRLYHDDQGFPLFYSMEDLPGNYIDIDHATYTNPPIHVRVIDKKLVTLETAMATRLRPATSGTCCHPDDIGIVVDATQPHKKWKLN